MQDFIDNLMLCEPIGKNYKVILKPRKLPWSILNDHLKQTKFRLLDTRPSEDTFGPKRKRIRPGLLAVEYDSLLKKADGSHDAFEEKIIPTEGSGRDGARAIDRRTMFDKGQSKRIWDELYKVIDSSDVVVQGLDARDPQGTRCYHLERYLEEHFKHKQMVLLLNKPRLLKDGVRYYQKNILL